MGSSSSAWIPRLDRWAGLSAAMIMMGCAGLTYTYAVYSEHMKQRLHFSQEQVDDIGAAKDFGGVVAFLSGICYTLYPPWVTIAIGAALHLYGYSMFWMTIAGKVAPSFWLLCVYSAVGNGGDGWIDTACMMTSLQNYEEHRGTAMGILKAQLGLSSAIFVMIYDVLIAPDVNKFLLLMSLVPAIASLLLAYFIKPFPLRKDEDGFPAIRFRMTFIAIVILGVYMMLSMACEEYFQVKKMFQRASIVLMLAIMLTMYTLPLVRFPPDFFHGPLERIVAPEGIDLPKLRKKDSEVAEVSEEEASSLLTTDVEIPEDTKSQGTHAGNHPVHVSLRDSVADFNFWLVFLVVTIGAGTGVAIFNNFAQIGKALRAGGTDIYVGLISIWSCFGRLGSGYGSDHLMRHGYPRTLCLLITQISMTLCCLLLATGLLPSLFLGSALTGLTYGAYWTLVPAILSEVFGVHNFTVLYKLVSLGPPLGSYLLSAKVMGYLYDEEAIVYHQHSSASNVGATGGDDGSTCYGVKCFGFGLLALSFVSFIGASASFFLFLGTRAVYNKTKL